MCIRATLYALYVSLTFVSLGIIAAFAVLPLTMCVPQIFGLFRSVPEKTDIKEAL